MGRFTRLPRDETNMNRRITIGKVGTSGCALVLFGSLVFFASAALAQTCTPVVYAFRHAEDTNPPNPPGPIFALTPTGQAHAALYPTMVSDFQAANNYCPVTKVYAATKAKKVPPCGTACDSASNSFDTGTPLARAIMKADPITTVDDKQLYEYLGNGNDAPSEDPKNYLTPTATALRTELLKRANLGQSSAIFWTSQGLHVLGGAIINGTSNVPDKNAAINPSTPPRNAVYLFEASGSAPSITGFKDTPRSDREPEPRTIYIQCYNHVEYSEYVLTPKEAHFIDPTGNPPTQLYYCGYGDQSNLGGKPGKSCPVGNQCGSSIENDRNKDIKGKICQTSFRDLVPEIPPGQDIFGACK